jgi:hypothetical protein
MEKEYPNLPLITLAPSPQGEFIALDMELVPS